MTPPTLPLLELDGVVKHFAVKSSGLLGRTTQHLRAVDDVSFVVPEGSSFGLVGESGSGKTTITRLVLMLETVTRGAIRFKGADITGGMSKQALLSYRSEVQAVFQDASSSLSPKMRIREIVSEPLEVQRGITGLRRSEIRERAVEMLRLVGLRRQDIPDRYMHELSGGEKQRVAIARALSVEPSLVVLDEPVSALDVSVRSQVLNLLADLKEQQGLTYLIVGHDLALLRHVTDHVAVMYMGEVVEFGETERVMREPVHPYTKGLLDAVPRTRAARKRTQPAVSGEIASPLNPPPGCRFHPRCRFAEPVCPEINPPLVPHTSEQSAACHVFNPADELRDRIEAANLRRAKEQAHDAT